MKHTLFIFAFLFLMPIAAFAADDHPTIGQIQASGATADDEFIELLNPSAQPVEIGSWSIQYKSSSGMTFYKKNFVKGASMPANGKYIIAGSGYTGTYDMKHSSFSLSSAGGTVFLVSNQTLLTSTDATSIVDQKTYSTDVEAKPPQAPAPEVSPPATTPIIKQPEVLTVTINEFMPAPTDGEEWVELYNNTGYAIDLTGWTLADGTGKSFVDLTDLLLPNQFKLIELTSSHLNNTGDLIILRDANKREVDSVAYGDWENNPSNAPVGDDGVAIARIGDGRDTNIDNSDFSLTNTPTPGAANVITAPTGGTGLAANDRSAGTKTNSADIKWLTDLLSKQSDEIAKLLKADNIIIINNLNINSSATKPIETATVAKTEAKTTAVKTTTTATKTTTAKPANTAGGMVIVPAGIVGKDICVVREENRSVEVRLPSEPIQMPVAGDIVTASGAWSTAKTLTLPRLLVRTTAAFSITDHGTPPEPVSIPMSRINDHIGEIISTSGTIVEKQSTKLRITDGGNESLVVKTNMEAKKGDVLSATGLIVKNGADILLTPTSADALAIIKPPAPKPPSLVERVFPYGLAAMPAAILSGAVYFGKRMKKKGGDAGGGQET